MSLETSASRMRRLGRAELVEGEIPSLDELIARIDAVTADDVAPRHRPGASRTRRARSPSSARTTRASSRFPVRAEAAGGTLCAA